jgi:MFS superfamily sulfate permease-like transporter
MVALPLAMAFGIASGVTPQAGLYTAIVAALDRARELHETLAVA